MVGRNGAADGAEPGGPLAGYKIIDLTNMISGPLATMMLGDQGADVIKVEAPGKGDYVRSGLHRSGGLAANFLNNNRNKRSIALDLKKPEGREILLRLAADADVFIQNFRPGVVERLGVGEADVRAVKPDIVYVSLSGFGENGPYAAKPVYDPIIQAASGLASVQGGSDQNQPRLIRTILPDKLTAVTAAQAVTAALLARERDGIGQHVRLSMLDAVMAFLWSSDMGGQTFIDKPEVAEKYVREVIFKNQISKEDFYDAIGNSPYAYDITAEHIQVTTDTMAKYGTGKMAKPPVAKDWVKTDLLEQAKKSMNLK